MKLLLVIPHFNNIEYGIISSFRRLGMVVKPVFFSVGFSKANLYQRVKNKLGFNLDKYLLRRKKRFNKRLLSVFDQFKPDIVYVVQGRWVDNETLLKMNDKSFVALYLWDMMQLFPEMHETFKNYHLIFSFDSSDTKKLLSEGYYARFRPSSYDCEIYRPIQSDKTIDLCFIGAMYPERVTILRQLVKDFPYLNIKIYGKLVHFFAFTKWLKWFFGKERRVFRNKNLNRKKVNKIYNQSKIVLSIVRANQSDGWSSRLPEILGSGSFQLTNYFPSVEKEFSDCLSTYKSYDELKEKIVFYLGNEPERLLLANNGLKKVSSTMTEDAINAMLIGEYKKWITKKGKICE